MDVGGLTCVQNSGAYTIAAGCTFNGFPRPKMVYTFSTQGQFDDSVLPEGFPIRPSGLQAN
jgi:hypothetical protein